MFNDIGRVKALIDLVAEEQIAELQIVDAGVEFHIVLRDLQGNKPQRVDSPLPRSVDAPAIEAAPATQDHHASGQHVVVAPMPGTFFRAAGADGKPLVDVGAEVQPGMPVCIVEAMKILNEVAADRAGKVLQILAEDGQVVEQGQGLFVIGAGA